MLQEESKFRPKACVMPPSPSEEETPDVNPLDVKPGVKVYLRSIANLRSPALQVRRRNLMFLEVIEGKVTDWRGKFGFMSSDQMEGKIFLHRLASLWSMVIVECGISEY